MLTSTVAPVERLLWISWLVFGFQFYWGESMLVNSFSSSGQNLIQEEVGRKHTTLFMSAGKEIENRRTQSLDPFAHLAESNPYDDPEPASLTSRKQPMPKLTKPHQNSYKIPEDPDEEWEWFYNKLKARQDGETGQNAIEESLLRNWMANQRKSFMKTLGVLDIGEPSNWGTDYLPLGRKRRLDSVGFYWGHLQPESLTNELVYTDEYQRKVRLKYKDWIWTPKYEALLQYKEAHGNTRVPMAHIHGLGAWAATQRKVRWKMPERRRKLLDAAGFDWSWKDSNTRKQNMKMPKKSEETNHGTNIKKKSVSFPRRLNQLKEYRKKHGDCNVPIDYEGGLGEWVALTKSRGSKFSPRTVKQLEQLGFEFES
mmetsp:Transcript_6341/g.9662  ORF Transcript_6341/g.9662 Transcript_6341/m.9662 type:complete len:369 (+) Transcript_6341:194-1300(+)